METETWTIEKRIEEGKIIFNLHLTDQQFKELPTNYNNILNTAIKILTEIVKNKSKEYEKSTS